MDWSRTLALTLSSLILAAAPALAGGRTVVVGVYENAPKVFTDEAGAPAGIFIDVLRAVAAEEGWDLEFRRGTWAEGLDRLARGELDLMPDVAHSAARERLYGFPQEPVLTSWFQVYAREGLGIRSLLDLAGKRVLVLERSVQQAAFDDLIAGFSLQVTVTPVQDYSDMFQRVADGSADAAVTNSYYGLRHARRYGLVDTAIIFQPTQLYFVTPRDRGQDLRASLDRHLTAMKADQGSVYYRSLERWTARGAQRFVPDWVKYAGAAALAALGVSVLASLRLKRLVDARTHELREREGQLAQAQKLEAIGRLAGGIAHDFNNLLSVILGYSELLLGDPALSERARGTVRRVHQAGERAGLLTHQLLAFSRGQVLRPEVLDVDAELQDMADLLRRMVGPEIELVIVGGDAPRRVLADRGRLQQIVMNLAINARDAMPAGGSLTIETGEAVLDDAYVRSHPDARPGPHVMLAVTDTGEGMSRETLSRIFEPFFTTKERGKGTGLGLATVYGVVKQSGGNVWVYSEPGLGTTFKVYLPRVDEAAAQSQEAEQPPRRPPGSDGAVLVVDDQEDLRDLLREVLEPAGFRVLCAADTAAGLALFEAQAGEVHLLLTDVVVPELGGVGLAQELLRRDPSLRVVYLSGYTGKALGQLGGLPPGSDFLEKPILPQALFGKVREVLARPA
ncbi:MAG: transporter substrate-binding domain-containing protein [Planctomycetota bacterium]